MNQSGTGSYDKIAAHLRVWAIPLAMAALSTVFALIGEPATLLLRYERTLILDSEWWRLLTGNFVHLGWPHLLMNLAGLGLIWALFKHKLPLAGWLIITVISACATGLGLLIFNPELVWYVGLSGLLHGLFAAGLWSRRERGDWLLFVLLSAKLIWEQAYGAMPGSAETAGGAVIVDAHLYGAVGGLIAALGYRWFRR